MRNACQFQWRSSRTNGLARLIYYAMPQHIEKDIRAKDAGGIQDDSNIYQSTSKMTQKSLVDSPDYCRFNKCPISVDIRPYVKKKTLYEIVTTLLNSFCSRSIFFEIEFGYSHFL